MKIIDNIREAAGNYQLKQAINSNQRTRKLINYQDVTSVGIVYALTDIESFYIVHEEALRLQKEKVKVKALGLVLNANLTRSLMPLLAFDFIYEKHLNWYRKPKLQSVEEFLDTEFDVLIDLNVYGYLPLKFIAASSIARLKVGNYEESLEKIYDIMITFEKGTSLKPFIQNINYYLTQLKPASNAQ